MRVVLAFLPEWRYCRQPYLALPALAAHLKRIGHDVRCLDLNLAFLTDLAGDGIGALHGLTVSALGGEEGVGAAAARAGQSSSPDLAAAWVAAATPDWLRDRVRRAFELLRDPLAVPAVRGHRAATNTLDRLWDATRALLAIPSSGTLPTAPEYQEVSLQAVMTAAMSPLNAFRPFMERQADSVAELGPDLVGLSVAAAVQLVPALSLAHALRRRKIAPLVLGGNLVTRLLPQHAGLLGLLDVFDALIYGEGEASLEELLRLLGVGRDVAGAPGTIARSGRRLVIGPPAARRPAASLPTPDFTDTPAEAYLAAMPHLPLLAGRGCYWRRCAFCAHHAGYGRHVLRPAEAVADDMQSLADRHGVSVFTFEDDDLSPAALRALAAVLKQRRAAFRWGCYARLERAFSGALAAELADAGCRYVFFGLESACQRTLERMNKGVTLSHVPALLDACRRAGIFVQLSLQFGYPGETLDEAALALRFVDEHCELIDGVSWQRFRLEGLSPLARNPRHYGLRLLHGLGEELAVYRRFQSSEGMLGDADIGKLVKELSRIVVARSPCFALNHFPAYHAYSHTREELAAWLIAADGAERAQAGALALALRPAVTSPDVILARAGGRVIAFDWRTGQVSTPDAEVAAALVSGVPPGWRVPVRYTHLFSPDEGGGPSGRAQSR
jgi:hypothetical protein